MAEVKTIKAEDFKTRSELEDFVRNKIGLTTDPKPKYIIEGKVEDLRRLYLSQSTIFWGISCKELDAEPKEPVEPTKVDRGVVVEGGINLNKEI